MFDLISAGKKAKQASRIIAKLSADDKNRLLQKCAAELRNNKDYILAENDKDIANAKANGMSDSMLDRLRLTDARVNDMANGLEQIARLPDPLGEVISMKTMPNGLVIGQKRVPMGVIGIIFEARPNVTADAFAISFKAGSAVILRGGKEAILTNTAIANVFNKTSGLCDGAVTLITDTSRETATEFMRLKDYVDVLIPRGGAGLIKSVVENSTIPVIETGTGNCHIFVDKSADLSMALDIIVNAKTQRPSVCNACETVLLHRDIAKGFLPKMSNALESKGVELRGDAAAREIMPQMAAATDDDFATEFVDLILAVGVVADINAAIEHIERYSTGHSEAIITESYANSQQFLNEVDAAAVYVNASTRFTDGGEFGFGAEIGISTQKLHARGPMGLKELTSTKYIIYGAGQIRG